MKALYTTTFDDRSKSFRWLIDYAARMKRSVKGNRLTALTQRMMGCSNGMWTEAKTQALGHTSPLRKVKCVQNKSTK